MLNVVRPIVVTAAVLMAVAQPGTAEAQYFRLAINEINLWGPQDTTESTCPDGYWPNLCLGWDRTDEVYFTVAGVTGDNAAVSLPFILLPPHGSPYGMREQRAGGPSHFRNIPLWDGHWQYLVGGQYAFFAVFVRERDVEPLTLRSDVNNAAAEMRQVRLNPALTEEAAVAQLESAALRLYYNLLSDTDDILAAFTVRIRRPGLNPGLASTWKQLDSTSWYLQSNWGARFYRSVDYSATVDEWVGWAYEISANIQQLVSPVVSRHSGKCLDVANAALLGGANVQQYACSGSVPGYVGYYDEKPNQQWILNPSYPELGSTFSLISLNSGLCLDVAAGSREDGANVQQYACQRLGRDQHQQWRFTYVSTTTPTVDSGYELRNVNSGKCLDVAEASLVDGGNVQQFTCHGGRNQWWFPYGYVPFRR